MSERFFAKVDHYGHEKVIILNYPQVGLKSIIAIHNSVLGPALGGCRMRAYESESEAFEDVLRLSEGMTYKNSLADLPLGGGKACIIADPSMREGRKELLLKFAECVNTLGGTYYTAEDMGTTVKDLSLIRTVTKYAAGYPVEYGGSGDPSPWTALGVFNGILAACEVKFGSKDLSGKKVVIQGVGNVGTYLLEKLTEAGADCYVTDRANSSIDKAARTYGATVVGVDACYDVECDIFCPCAIGQTINSNTIHRLNCSVIAGGANNQLSVPGIKDEIMRKNITYCPDFAINAGGVISIAGEFQEEGWNYNWVHEKVSNIYNTISLILKESLRTGEFAEDIAIKIAKEKISSKMRKEDNNN